MDCTPLPLNVFAPRQVQGVNTTEYGSMARINGADLWFGGVEGKSPLKTDWSLRSAPKTVSQAVKTPMFNLQ